MRPLSPCKCAVFVLISRLLPLALSFLLTGCLQVELAGPIAGATVTITRLDNGAIVVSNLRSSTVTTARAELGEEKWSTLVGYAKALFLGNVEIPNTNLDRDAYYLVTATGGTDQDSDANGVLDAAGTRMQKPVRAIMTGAQLSQPAKRINMLSEAIYRVLEPELGDLSAEAIGSRLDRLSRDLVEDINNDGQIDYEDVLIWSNFYHKNRYKGPAEFLSRLARTFHDPIYSDLVATYDSFNVVENASFSAHDTDNDFGQDLILCAFAVTFEDLCTFQTLPLIGMETSNPDVDDIMARLVTSDDWIANRFEQVLSILPADILLLFRSVTVITIGTEIRPSYYSPAIGSINLDADYFWLELSELGTVSTEPDFRLEFAREVNFEDRWRYVEGDFNIYWPIFDSYETGSRQLEDIEMPVAALLLHELAHATDEVRPESIATLRPNWTMLDLTAPRISDDLQRLRPLTSDTLAGLASVLYFGVSATPEQANYTAAQVGTFFAPEPASDLYGYADQYEYLAMLFEEAMMAILYGVQRDIAFTTVPADNVTNPPCSAYRVGWGMRGRITAPQVLPGAMFAVDALLPGKNYSAQLDQLPEPILMDTSTDWCDSIYLTDAPRSQSIRPLASFQAELRRGRTLR